MSISNLSFSTPVVFEKDRTFGNCFLEKVDGYFSLSGKRAFVISGINANRSYDVVMKDYEGSDYSKLMFTALKVVTYATLVIPALMFFLKVALRSNYTFNLVPDLPRVLTPLAEQDPANLYRDLTMIVQLNLNVDSIVALGKTSRTWANLTNNPQLWRNLLTRDFGEECSMDVPDQYCKQKYILMYKTTQLFMGEIKRTVNLGKETSRSDHSVKLCGLISYTRFYDIILYKTEGSGLTREQIISFDRRHLFLVTDILQMAAGRGLIPIIKAIMQSPCYSKIPAASLGDVFIQAAGYGQITAMEVLKKSPRFSEIPAASFAEAFFRAAGFGEISAMELIKKIPEFSRVSDAEISRLRYDLRYALDGSAFFNNFASIDLIMEDPRFANMSTVIRRAPLLVTLHIMKNRAVKYFFEKTHQSALIT